MKKTLLVTIDFPPNLGGVAKYYQDICNDFESDKIVVLTMNQEKSEEFDSQQKYKIYRNDLLYKFIWPKWLKMIFAIKKIVKQENIGHIHVGQILPVGEAVLFTRLPFTVFAHGMDITIPQNNLRKKIVLKKIIKKSEKLIANSNFTKQELVKLGAGENKVEIIHPKPNKKLLDLVDQNVINQIKEKYNLQNKKVLLSVGRLVKRKGFDDVIIALPEVLKEIPNLVYIIIGDGPERKNLNKVIQDSKLSNVVITGSVNEKELAAYYSLCDAFIMTSKQLDNGDVEGFGIVYLEADMFNKPVIGRDSGGIKDAIDLCQDKILIRSEREIALSIIRYLK
ncbi:glycosyltransferase family 4 protein [Patescibacteria group bacterium]|nr:glycosyltransferase family 4 protein [Patescibacteria group bacterium]